MLNPRVCSVMELLPLVCLWILTWSGGLSADPNGPLIPKITVAEENDIVLNCSFDAPINEGNTFKWMKDGWKTVYDTGTDNPNHDQQFKGRVSHFKDKLQSGNASIVIKKTKVADSGNYTCDFPHENPSRRSKIELTVHCTTLKDRTEENIPGTCPTPVIRHVKSNDGVDLECKVVDASPKPEVEVRDSSGTRVPDKEEKVSENGNDYIVLTAVVTMEDYYHCVVEQSEICHQIKSPETYASPHDSTLKISANGGLLVFLVLFLLLLDLQ